MADIDPGCPDYPRFVRGRDSVLAYFNKLFRERIVIYDGVRAWGRTGGTHARRTARGRVQGDPTIER